jgi:CubicO group peptidase (beta-lactamase class C family)
VGKLHNGSMHTGGGLFLRPRDMAKTGYLFLNGGRWQGKQIVSEQWVRESTKQPAPSRLWLPMVAVYHPVARSRSGAYAVQGHGGQFIFVIPVLEMVTVITSWNVGPRAEQPFEMLQKYILPAAEAANPAP